MRTLTESWIAVPGGRLRYVTQGSGPLLLLVAGGHGDASKSQPLASQLAEDHTVLTYDRRGLSGSSTDLPARSLAEHADDASRLLAEVTSEPAYVYGSSVGGLIALDLVSVHPEQVRLLVAHEPPVLDLMTAPARDTAAADLVAVEQLCRSEGVDAALHRFAEMIDLDPEDREADVRRGAPTPQEAANMEFLAEHDLPAIRTHALDLDRLRRSSARVVPAVGGTSAHTWPHACGRLLADSLGVAAETLPGGHLGYVQRPRETAARLRELLGGQSMARVAGR